MSLDYWLFTKEPYLVNSVDVGITTIENTESHNITHNLTKMANNCKVKFNESGFTQKEISLYNLLWHPIKFGFTKNDETYRKYITILYNILFENETYFKKFNAEKGWGTYEGLLSFVEKVINLCNKYPDYYINVSV